MSQTVEMFGVMRLTNTAQGDFIILVFPFIKFEFKYFHLLI